MAAVLICLLAIGYVPVVYLLRRPKVDPITYEGKEPNWRRIDSSDVWHEEIAPMLQALKVSTLESLARASSDDIPRLQGSAVAIDMILKKPAQMVALNNAVEHEKERNNGRIGSHSRVRVGY